MQELPINDGVQEIRLDKWCEFFQLTTGLFANNPAMIYRGQANYDWPLVSTLDRLEAQYPKRKGVSGLPPKYFDCPPFTEEQHLRAFRKTIASRRGPNAPKLDDDALWTLGQHHGLKTPMLDWTRSPFIGLFFAFEEESCTLLSGSCSEPAYRGVYMLSTSTIESPELDDTSKVRLVTSEKDANYRLISQAAHLIRMPRQTDLEGYVSKHFTGDDRAILTKIKIPNEDRHGCLIALDKMNINHATLFPDIDGAAKHVNSLWQPGHESVIAYVD